MGGVSQAPEPPPGQNPICRSLAVWDACVTDQEVFFSSFSPVYFFDKDFWDAYYDFHSLTHIQT